MRELRLSQRGPDLEIRYVAPRLTAEGQRLGLLEVEVMRAGRDGDFEETAERTRTRVAPGEVVVSREPLPPPGTALRLAARAIHRGAPGNRTTIVSFTSHPPPAAPEALTAELGAQGVRLSWQGAVPEPVARPTPPPSPSPSPHASSPSPANPPSTTATPSAAASPSADAPPSPSADVRPSPSAGPPSGPVSPSPAPSPSATPEPVRTGFWIYRRPRDGAYGAPLNPDPAPSAPYVDAAVQPGESWCYAVTAVASADPVVESAPSSDACVDVKDVVAPARPTGVAALASADAVEVSWSPSADADLVRYRVYRGAPGEVPELRGEVAAPETRFRDAPVPAGADLVYTVTAVDQAGNESPPSAPARASAP